MLDQVLAASNAAGAAEAAALFADLLKTASAQDIASLSAKTSPGGDFTYDLNEEEDGIIIKRYTGTSPVLIIPAEIEGYPVVELAEEFKAFCLAVVIPENIRKIGRAAFMGSTIHTVTLPSSLTVIEAFAFSNSNISAVTFSSGLTVMGENAFGNADKLSEVDLSHTGLTRIAALTFSDCDQLQTVKLPDSVTVIECGAFSFCSALTDINIPAGIQAIGASPSDSNSVLSSKSVGEVFYGCRELYNLAIPDSVTSIKFFKKEISWFQDDDGKGSTDFEGCSKLSITTRKRLQDLGYTGTF